MNTETQIDVSPIALDSVDSSQIAAIGHNPETDTLAIRFRRKDGSDGSLYHYANVTTEDFSAFKNAASVGSHFYKHIKPDTEKYPYVRIVEQV